MGGSARVQRLKSMSAQRSAARREVAKKAVGYIRVSTEEQARQGYGLKAQERALRAFAASQGYELLAVVSDAGVSGASRPEDRPGFQHVLSLAEEGSFSVLLVWKFDRLARNLTYAVVAANNLRERFGAVLRSVTEPIDTATPMGETIFAVLSGMAAQERRAITERTLAGKREKAARGGFAGGATPFGYRRDNEGGLVIDSGEAEVVRRIHTLRRKGASYGSIAGVLNQEEIPAKRGGIWYPATVRYLLDNPKYRGFVEYFFRWEGEAYVLEEGSHTPILPKVRRIAG